MRFIVGLACAGIVKEPARNTKIESLVGVGSSTAMHMCINFVRTVLSRVVEEGFKHARLNQGVGARLECYSTALALQGEPRHHAGLTVKCLSTN